MWFACCKKASVKKTLADAEKPARPSPGPEQEVLSSKRQDAERSPVDRNRAAPAERVEPDPEIRDQPAERLFLADHVERDPKVQETYTRNTEDFGVTLYSLLKIESYQMQPPVTQLVVDRFCRECYADLRTLMVYQEPPLEHRWKIWKALAGGSKLVSAEAYVRLTDHTLSSAESQTLIQGDIERTFASSAFFSGSSDGKAKLGRICTAVDVYFKHIRYTQGMSLILGLLLQVSGGHELETFNFYLHLMKARKFQYHSVLDDFFTFNQFLNFFFKQKLRVLNPRLAQTVDGLDFPDDCWIGKWWISLFAGYCDEYLVVRVIDFLLVTSLVNIVDVGLAIATILAPRLEKADLVAFNSIVRELDCNPEIQHHHPHRLIALASTFISPDAEVLAAMQAFIDCEATSAQVRQRMVKHKEQYETFLLAAQQDQAGIGHEDIAMSVFSLREGDLQREALS